MSTKTATETETETTTMTATGGACAVGAGVVAFACKPMVIGFFAGLMAIFGVTGISQVGMLTVVMLAGAVAVWIGFRHAGRKPVALGLSGLATMWWGFILSGALTQGTWTGALFDPSAFLTTPGLMVPVVALYASGIALFFLAVYLAYLKPTGVSKGATAGGFAVMTMCSGSGLTGVLGGTAVAVTGTAGALSPTVLTAMVLGGVLMVGVALYKRAFQQAGLIAAGFFVAWLLPWRIVDRFIAGDALMVGGMALTYVGLAIMFLGLFWVYRPEMNLLPRSWRESKPMRVLQASLKG